MTSTTWETRPELPDGAPEPRPARAGEPAWRPWMAPVALLVVLLAASLGFVIVAGIGAALGHSIDDGTPPGVIMGSTFLQDLGFVVGAVLFARMTGPTSAEQFGLRRTAIGSAIGWIFVFYLGYIAFAAVYQQFVEVEPQTDLLRDLGVEDSTLALIGALVTVCLLAPIVEEFFFRGFFYRALKNGLGLWPGAILTGVVFGGIHFMGSPVEALIPLAVLGFALCLLYEKTGSLYPCIAVHAINNAIAFGSLNDWTWETPLLVVGSVATCFLITVPLARRWSVSRRMVPASAPASA